MTQDRRDDRQHSEQEEIPCTVVNQRTPRERGILIPYDPPTTPVLFHILAVPQDGWTEYTPGVLVEAGMETDPAWYQVLTCGQEDLVNRVLRPFPQSGNPESPFRQFSTLELAQTFVNETTKPRWFLDQSGAQLQAAVEGAARVFGTSPDIWVTQPTLFLNGTHPSLQIGEAGALFSLAGALRVVGVTEGMSCLQIELPKAYEKERAWFEPGSGSWQYVELRYPEEAGRVPSWTVGDNRGSLALAEQQQRKDTKQ